MSSSISQLRVALVHDYLREYGGAERVVEALHELFPEAPLYTAFVDKDALDIHWKRFQSWKIIESSASQIPLIRKLYSPMRLFASYFFEEFDFSQFDIVISSTNMYMAKSILTGPDTIHICYCHTPPRSLYGYNTQSNWRGNPFTRIIGELINFRMRQIDFLTSKRPDIFVANSKETSQRIAKFYQRESIVIYPPVELPVAPKKNANSDSNSYFLYAGRLAFAKHPEIAVEACSKLGLPLKVAGTGGQADRLKEIAGHTVELLGAVNDQELASLYMGAKALLYPVEDEDFGIVPVEAMMYGTPVIAHRSGGPKETIIEGKTGSFFDELSVNGLIEAIKKFDEKKFDREKIQLHAAKFSKKRFQQHIEELILDKWKAKHKN